jgi:pimeloyl-ACP methyl ester carboxylesterase
VTATPNPEITHRDVEVEGVRLHLAEAGTGPTVLLLHGFPECWYSWRHQLVALAAAGFHAVAPDQRGYGRSDAPEAVERYSILHLVGDALGVLDAVGAERAVVVGHDWGAPVAWHTALLRPDRVRGVAGLSVPLVPRSPVPPLAAMRASLGEGYYMVHFQQRGVADAELGANPRETFRRLLGGTGGEQEPPVPVVPEGGGFLDALGADRPLPGWLTEEDLDVFVDEYAGTGFTGGLNWYRNLDRNWELSAPWRDARVRVPALYLAGDRDLVLAGRDPQAVVAVLRRSVPGLRRAEILPGCGHWTQQERPAEVSEALIDFARALDS